MHKRELIVPSFKTLLEEFNTFIYVQGYVVKQTVGQINGTSSSKENFYGKQVTEFLCYLQTHGIKNIQKVKRAHLVNYQEYLKERPNRNGGALGTACINSYLNYIRLFFEYLRNSKQVEQTPVFPKNLKIQSESREILSIEEINQLYEKCKTKRERAVLGITFGCGLRKTELERLDLSNIQFSSALLVVRKGKRTKRREVSIPDGVLRDLKDYLLNERTSYLKKRKASYHDAFLINNRGTRMRGECASRILNNLIMQTKNKTIIKKNITLHSLRSSIATILLDNGASVQFVKDFLGHSSIDTVHIYAKRRKMKQKQIALIKNSF